LLNVKTPWFLDRDFSERSCSPKILPQIPRSFHEEDLPSAPSPKSLGLRCVQNGSSARREEGAYPDRYVTDEQRSSRPIFNATPWAGAGWLFFCVARSAVMIQIAALRSLLEKQPTGLRRNPRDLGDGALSVREWHGFAEKPQKSKRSGLLTVKKFSCILP
jgi:hypothetical protein